MDPPKKGGSVEGWKGGKGGTAGTTGTTGPPGIGKSTRRKCTHAYTCSGFPGAAKPSAQVLALYPASISLGHTFVT